MRGRPITNITSKGGSLVVSKLDEDRGVTAGKSWGAVHLSLESNSMNVERNTVFR